MDLAAQLQHMDAKLDAILQKLEVAQDTMDRHDLPLSVMQNHVYNVEACMQRSVLAWPFRRLLRGWAFSFVAPPQGAISYSPVKQNLLL